MGITLKNNFTEYLKYKGNFDYFSGIAYKEAVIEVSKACFDEFFEDFLEEWDKEQLGIRSYKFEELVSPKFYNYSTDKVFGKIEVDLNQFKQTMTKMILENKEKFQELLDERHKSRSGFFSFYSTDLGKWLTFESREVTSDGDENPDSPMLETFFMFYSEFEKGEQKIDELYNYAVECLY